MNVNGKNYRTIWMEGSDVFMIEQNLLPYEFNIYKSESYQQTCDAIITMKIRGAGAIGAAAGYAMAQALHQADDYNYLHFLQNAKREIELTRSTAQNLFAATNRVWNAALTSKESGINEAYKIADDDAETSKLIGNFGNSLIINNMRIATHCNAGWLAFVDYGTALSPVYAAFNNCKNPFVYVDETRPRGQGARLTAWELKNQGVNHVIIPDNAAAWLMMKGKIDMYIVGADRIAANGDVANKIGTLEKAIAAKEFNIPFYVAAPSSTFDLNCASGNDIPIEERSENEVLWQSGLGMDNIIHEILVASPGSAAFNPSFDVTPAKFITGIITEKGIIKPQKSDIEKIIKL